MLSYKQLNSVRRKTVILILVAGLLCIVAILFSTSRSKSLKIVPNSPNSQQSYKVIGGHRQIKHTYFETKTDSENRPGFVIDDATAQIRMHFQPEDQLKQPDSEPQLNTESNEIIFPSIRPATDLRYTPLESGVKEEIILRDKSALESLITNPGFAFDLELSGVTYETDAVGNIIPVFTDTTTGATFTIPPAFMSDATGAESTNVTQTFTKQESGENIQFQIRVVPDLEWLQDASRQFPILIDPTVIKGAAPISYWPLNEGTGSTAGDTSTNANALTITNTTWIVDAARSNSQVGKVTLRFDGSGDFLTRTYDSDYNFGTGSFSVSMWVKIPNAAAGPDVLVARYADAGFKIYMDANEYICFSIDDDSTWEPEDPACSTTTYNDSTWHHIEAVKNTTSSIILYIDGKMIKTNAATTADSSLSGTNPPLYIGIDSDGSSNSFQGDIDSISIFNYARDANQVKADAFIQPQTSTSVGTTVVDTNSNGLIGHWKMNETSWNGTAGEVIDSSGNGNHGVRSGNATTVSGKYGSGGTFDGDTDYVTVNTHASLNPTSQVTISGWIKYSNIADEQYYSLVRKGGIYQLYAPGSSNAFAFYIYGATNDCTNTNAYSSLVVGNWYHIVGVYDGKNKNIYVDGSLVASSVCDAGTLDSSAQALTIGYANTDYDVNGSLDDVRVYNRALSPAEVQALYNWAPHPVAYWDCNEGSGQIANDKSGNGNTMTLGSSVGTDVNDPSWTTGKFGNALNFDLYDDDYATVTSSSAPTGQNPWTLSLWAEIEDATIGGRGYRSSLVHWGDSTVPINDYSYSNLTYVYTPPTTTVDWTTSPSSIVNLTSYSIENRWNYLTVTYDGTSVRTYFNGIFQTSANHTMAIEGSDIIFGGYPLGMKSYGKIDEVKIYNYARTPAQILEDMNAGHPVGGSPVGSQVGYWKFDEAQGTTAYDQSINANNLTLSAAGWSMSGKYGPSYDGATNRRLTRDDDVDFDFTNGTDDFTLSLWFNRGGAISNQEYLVDKHSSNDGYNIYMDSDGDLVCGIGDGTSLNEDTAGTTNANYDDTNWHQATCVKTGTTSLKLYVDGNEVASDVSIAADGDMSNSGKLIIGDTNETDDTDEWLGDIDELKIYRAALIPDQVQTEYNQGKGQVMGAVSTASDGVTADSSVTRSYCPPGNVEGNCAPGQNPAPVVTYQFNENTGTSTINDTSGNGNYGSMAGSITEDDWVPGNNGSALNLGGTDEYVGISNYSSLNISAPGSFSVWVKTTLDACKPVYSMSHSTSNYTWVLYTGDGCTGSLTNELITVGRFNSTTTYILGYTTATRSELLDGKWHHIYVTMGSGTVKIYLDGIQRTVSVGSGSNNGTFGGLSQMDNAEIGSRLYNNNARIYFNGAIDDLKIFNYARTPAQIAWDYNRGKPVAQWKLDECTGATIHSSNENYNSALNGTWTGAGGGTQTSVGDCSTAGTAWGNGASGKYNGSLNFDGFDDRVTIPSNANLNLFNELSFGGWVKTSYAESSAQTILSKGNFALSGTSSKFALVLSNSGNVGAFYRNLSTSIGYARNLRDGNWHHVLSTISASANSWKLFIDGKQVYSTTFTAAASADTTGDLDIGTLVYDTEPGSLMNGQIDDVQIFNYALTNQQVQTVFNSGAVRYE